MNNNHKPNRSRSVAKTARPIRVRTRLKCGVIIGKGGQELTVTTDTNGGFNRTRR